MACLSQILVLVGVGTGAAAGMCRYGSRGGHAWVRGQGQVCVGMGQGCSKCSALLRKNSSSPCRCMYSLR